jgi:lipopolysaccharide/colanic/teichoic acid biosynthesis glycosyltransferase
MEEMIQMPALKVDGVVAREIAISPLNWLREVLALRLRTPWVLFCLFTSFIGYLIFFRWSNYIGGKGLTSGVFFSFFMTLIALGLDTFEMRSKLVVKRIVINYLVAGLFAFFLGSLPIFYFSGVGLYGAAAWGAFGGLSFCALTHLTLARFIARHPLRFVIIGEKSDVSLELIRSATKAPVESSFVFCGEINSELEKAEELTEKEFSILLASQRVSHLVFTEKAITSPKLVDLLLYASKKGFRISNEISFFGQLFEKYPIQKLSRPVFLSYGFTAVQPVSIAFSRVLSIFLSLFGLILLSPFFALIGVMIKLSSRGPVIFTQYRAGRYGIPFKIYKYRTMSVETPDDVHLFSTLRKDPRVFWFGKILRRTHFDELPQLLNIFLGNMSFVGPRPEVSEFAQQVSQIVPTYDFRLLVRPGLTGLAQVNQGYTVNDTNNTDPVYKKLSYDLFYIRHQSFLLDALIVFQTFFRLVRKSQ